MSSQGADGSRSVGRQSVLEPADETACSMVKPKTVFTPHKQYVKRLTRITLVALAPFSQHTLVFSSLKFSLQRTE